MYIAGSLAIGTDGSIYYAAGGGTSTQTGSDFAVNSADGTLKWRSEKMDNIGINSQIVVGDDGIVYAIGNVIVYGFDPDNGSTVLKWELPDKLPYKDNDVWVKSGIGKLALTNEGNLIFGSVGSGSYYRSMYCLNPKSSQLAWYNIDAVESGVDVTIAIGTK